MSDYNSGHRDRLKTRFTEVGAKGLPDYELLELLLMYGIPRKDVKPLAKDLLKKYSTLSGVVGAPASELTTFSGIGDNVATYLKALEALVIRFRKESVRERPAFQNRLEILEYLHAKLGNLTKEEFHVLFLDAKHQILADECMSVGTINASAVYPREVVQAALSKGATGLILAHNHPSGQPQPSVEDLELTATLATICLPLGIHIYDHIIIGDGRHYSFRDKGQL